jgi:hypothetical protein
MTLFEWRVLCIIAIIFMIGTMYRLRHYWWPPWRRKHSIEPER